MHEALGEAGFSNPNILPLTLALALALALALTLALTLTPTLTGGADAADVLTMLAMACPS